MAACPTLSTGEQFLSTVLRHIDCQAQTVGATGYQALADPSSPISLVITALLTIFVALFGLRMMLGEAPTVRGMVMAVVKIGVVLAIATSWPAYRTVFYDVVIEGPKQLANAVSGPAGLPGAEGNLIGRLQAADASIIRLINYGTGRDDLATLPATAPGEPAQRAAIGDSPALGWARVLFLSSTVAAFAAVRVTAGVLLALAPLFAGLLLFDMARGLFIGWLRALVFAMLASVAVTVLLGVELALLEPWLAQVLQLRQTRALTPAAPIELLVLCLGFALALAGALVMLLRVAFTMSPASFGPSQPTASQPSSPSRDAPIAAVIPVPATIPHAPPRALAVADALLAAQRREGANRGAAFAARAPTHGAYEAARAGPSGDDLIIPSFSQASRRTRPRKSLGAALRDRRS